MIIEFEKRLNFLKKQIQETRDRTIDGYDLEGLKGELKATEELYAFYKSQMVDKGRIVPDDGHKEA